MEQTQDTLIVDKFVTGMVDETIISKVSYPPDACVDAQDVIFYPRGTVTKRFGFDKLHTSAWKADGIVKIYPWKSVSGTYYDLVFSPNGGASAFIGSAIVGSATTFNTITCTGATWTPDLTTPISCCSYAGSAVMTYNGVIQPLAWIGGSFAERMTAAPSGVKYVANWGNFMFAANVLGLEDGARRGSRLYWNYPANGASWPVDYYVDLDADDGDEITGIKVLGDYIVVFKTYKIFVGQWVGGTYMFQFTRVSSMVGCVSNNSIVERRGTLYFLAKDGMYSFNGYSPPIDISTNIKNHFLSVNMGVAYKAQSALYEAHHQIWITVPYGASTTNSRIYVYDYELSAWTKFNFAASSLAVVTWTATLTLGDLLSPWYTYDIVIGNQVSQNSDVMLVGTYEGFIDRYGVSTDDEGVAINGNWRSRWYDFTKPSHNKRILRITTLVEKQGSYNMNCDVYVDWDESTPNKSFLISLTGPSPVLERRLDFTKHIRSVQFVFYTNAVATPFTLHKFEVPYLIKGKTLVV
jgi:hypothetical protein